MFSLAQLLPHLNQIVVYFSTPVERISLSSCRLVFSVSGTEGFIELPCSVPPIGILSQSSTNVRLSISGSQSIPPRVSLLSARELATKSSIFCLECRSLFVELDNCKVLDLPSKHWKELLDCWACHSDPTGNPALNQLLTHGVQARPSVVYNSHDSIVVYSPQNINKASEVCCLCLME
jgi:hypothetical protein